MRDLPDRGDIIDHRDLEIVSALPFPDAAFRQQYPGAFEELVGCCNQEVDQLVWGESEEACGYSVPLDEGMYRRRDN